MSGSERPSRPVNCAIGTASCQKIARLYLVILNHLIEVRRIACHGDHRARLCIKIYSEESLSREETLDVLGVAIGGISDSPADDDSNGGKKREGKSHGSRKRFCHCSPTREFLLHEVG